MTEEAAASPPVSPHGRKQAIRAYMAPEDRYTTFQSTLLRADGRHAPGRRRP